MFDCEKAKTFLENNDILCLLKSERIFWIDIYDGKPYLAEACDDYFAIELNKEICQKISDAFSAFSVFFDGGE